MQYLGPKPAQLQLVSISTTVVKQDINTVGHHDSSICTQQQPWGLPCEPFYFIFSSGADIFPGQVDLAVMFAILYLEP